MEEVHKQLEKFKAMIVHYPEALEEAGYDVEVPEGFKPYFKVLPREEDLRPFLEFSSSVPLEAALDFSISGTPGECLDRIEAYVRAGVRHFILINVGPDVKFVMRLYAKEVIPRFREG